MGIFTDAARTTPAGPLGRVVNNFDLKNPAILKLSQALDKAKIRYSSPGLCGDATAHFVIARYKVAVHVLAQCESSCSFNVNRRREAWKGVGYKFYGLKRSVIASRSVDEIATDLMEILK